MSLTLEIAALAAYLAAALRQQPWRRLQQDAPALMLAIVAVTAHGLALGLSELVDGRWRLGLGEALSLFVWQCALVHLLLCLRLPLWHLGRWLWPAAGGVLLVAWLLPVGSVDATELSASLRLHILLSLLAWAALTLAALQAISYALQDAALHRGEHARERPPLQVMENLVFRLIGFGFILLCLSVASGFLFVDDFFAQHLVHKAVLSLFACLLFGLLLAGRMLRGWRGRTALRWLLGAYITLLLAYFGSKLVLEQILGLSWG